MAALFHSQAADVVVNDAARRTPSGDLVLRRVRSEYIEMPGLRLTAAQAQRLWGLDAATCESLLHTLIESNFLIRAADGTYARVSDGAEPAARRRMAKVDLVERRSGDSARHAR